MSDWSERVALGSAMVLVGLAALACKGSSGGAPDSAAPVVAVASATASATEKAAPADAAASDKPHVAVAKNPCKQYDSDLGGKCFRKCTADMDCDGVGGDCLPYTYTEPGKGSVTTKVCRLENESAPASASAAPTAALTTPPGAKTVDADGITVSAGSCPKGWSQIPSANDVTTCRRVCAKDADCHKGFTCGPGLGGAKICNP